MNLQRLLRIIFSVLFIVALSCSKKDANDAPAPASGTPPPPTPGTSPNKGSLPPSGSVFNLSPTYVHWRNNNVLVGQINKNGQQVEVFFKSRPLISGRYNCISEDFSLGAFEVLGVKKANEVGIAYNVGGNTPWYYTNGNAGSFVDVTVTGTSTSVSFSSVSLKNIEKNSDKTVILSSAYTFTPPTRPADDAITLTPSKVVDESSKYSRGFVVEGTFGDIYQKITLRFKARPTISKTYKIVEYGAVLSSKDLEKDDEVTIHYSSPKFERFASTYYSGGELNVNVNGSRITFSLNAAKVYDFNDDNKFKLITATYSLMN